MARQVERTCALCGSTNPQEEIMSTSAFGSSDLDGRPPALERFTLNTWVERCPACGYCAADLREKPRRAARAIVRSDAYRAQLEDKTMPKLACTFLCAAMLTGRRGAMMKARLHLWAAWACDDDHNEQAARSCRLVAVPLFEKAFAGGEHFYSDMPDADVLIVVDCLRRAGDFAAAGERLRAAGRTSLDDTVSSLLAYQESLIAAGDMQAHCLDEALEPAG